MSEVAPGTGVPTNENDLAVPDVGRPDYSVADKLTENVKILNGLVATVKERGVCQADVQAVTAIMEDVKESLPDIDTNIGLESYRGLFTPEPSLVNHQISVESFTEAVVKLIKKLIEEACKLAKNMYQWMGTLIKDLRGSDARCTDVQFKILEIRKLYKFLDPQFQWQNMPNQKAIAEEILMDPKLERSWMQTAGFGDAEYLASYSRQTQEVRVFIDQLHARLSNSVKMAEGLQFGVLSGVSLDDMLSSLKVAEKFLYRFTEEQPNPKYHVLRVPEFYLTVLDDVTSTPEQLNLEALVATYKKCEDLLARLGRIKFHNSDTAEAVEEMVIQVVSIMNIIDNMLSSLSGLSKARLKAAACHYNFFAKMINASKQTITDSKLSPEARSDQLRILEDIVKAAR